MKIKYSDKAKIGVFIALTIMICANKILGADIGEFFREEAIAAFNKANKHRNYCIRYFYREIDQKREVVVLMGECHFKKDKYEVQLGEEVLKYFSCIGCEESSHFTASSLGGLDPKLYLYRYLSSKKNSAGKGSTMQGAFYTPEIIESIDNALLIGLKWALRDLHQGTEKKSLESYISFENIDPDIRCNIILSGLLAKHLQQRELDSQYCKEFISKESLTQWLHAFNNKRAFLTIHNRDLVDQMLLELEHGQNSQDDIIIKSEAKKTIRIDLENGCKASVKDNIFIALNAAATWSELLALPALGLFYMTGYDYAGALAATGCFFMAYDLFCFLLDKKGRFDRYWYSLGIETRDKIMVDNINAFSQKLEAREHILAIIGLLHVSGVAEYMKNSYGFRELFPKQG